MKYYELINFFINKFDYKSYLELGLRDASNTFNNVNCILKHSVDINKDCNPTYNMSTNDFFEYNICKYDIIFIDADHEKNQVLKDFDNAFACLSPNGTIIMDDINPLDEYLLDPKFCNNAWEAWAELRTRENLTMHAIDNTYFGYVRVGQQVPLNLKVYPTYEWFNANRKRICLPIPEETLYVVYQ